MEKDLKEKILQLIKLRYQAYYKLLSGNVKELRALKRQLKLHAK